MRIHPTAEVAETAEVGSNTSIWHYAQIRSRVRIGQNCILGKGAYVDEDVLIGDNVKIQNRASIYKDCVIEDGVFIGPHACFTNDMHPRAINPDGSLKSAQDWHPGRTIVRYGASIGAGAIILPGMTIGRFALVGAGAVVTRAVADHALVVGNPARLVGHVCICGHRLESALSGWECSACGQRYSGDPTHVGPPVSETGEDAATDSLPSGWRTGDVKPTVAVVGLGKVGLPLAVQYASQGAQVIGCDINEAVVAQVNQGRSPIRDEADLDTRLARVHEQGLLTAVTNTAAAVAAADVVVVIVPMMVTVDHVIDFRAMDSATRAVGAGLQPGTLVVYETTLPLGTTRDRFGAILAETSGLTLGEEFSLAFSPERIRTGQIFRDLATYPKVVGGIDERSSQRAADFYRTVLTAPVMVLANAEAAELTKLMETAYRDVNIALANEFAVYAAARGIDVREVITAANSQPQSAIHEPGVGVGGHCIPVYPYFLMQDARPDELSLSRRSRIVNDGMAQYAASCLADHLDGLRGRKIVILGLAYRANVKELAFSSALRLVDDLTAAGADVAVHDPLFSPEEIMAAGAQPIAMPDIEAVDAIVIQAYHREYQSLPNDFFRRARVVLDGRSSVDPSALDLGSTVWLRIGTPPLAPAPLPA